MKTVREVCEQIHVTRKQLYYYDHIGLLKPTRRTGAQRAKLYSAKAVERLRKILTLQEAGLKLSEIRQVLDVPERQQTVILADVLERLHNEKDDLDRQIRILEDILDAERDRRSCG